MEKEIKKILEEVVNTLISEGKTVATMESCTGGGLVHYITNIPGASSALRLGIATYSNEAKIKVGGVPYGSSDEVHISVYDAKFDIYYNKSIVVTAETREENKMHVIKEASLMLLEVIKYTKDTSIKTTPYVRVRR